MAGFDRLLPLFAGSVFRMATAFVKSSGIEEVYGGQGKGIFRTEPAEDTEAIAKRRKEDLPTLKFR
jgi:hypothetical protein